VPDMGFRRTAVSFALKGVINCLCKIDGNEFASVLSKNEPLLVIFNHVNFLEIPILLTQSYPLYVSGIAKSETWKNPFFAFLFNTYRVVPINRDGAFSDSFKRVRQTIDDGFSICVAPEGTRSKTGVLQRGKAGIVQLALDTNVPILPVAHHGGESIWKNIKRFRRTPFFLETGRPFRIRYDGRPSRDKREEILTEVMGQVARLLPVQMRGIYAQQAECDCKYLDFI